VVEFDEDELDEAQTEADVKNITTKHQITIEELKREVLGSVKRSVCFIRSFSIVINPINHNRFGLIWLTFFNETLFQPFTVGKQ